MWKNPKRKDKKRVLAPTTQKLKDLREEEDRKRKEIGRKTKS